MNEIDFAAASIAIVAASVVVVLVVAFVTVWSALAYLGIAFEQERRRPPSRLGTMTEVVSSSPAKP
jgi:hypothetical protein